MDQANSSPAPPAGEDEGEGSEVCDRGLVGQPLSTWMDAAGPESWIGEIVPDRVELMTKAATCMQTGGYKLAKKRGARLFQQSAIELEAGSYGSVAMHK